MYLTRKHLARRTFLRGMGATLALPLLDAMIPAMTAAAKTATGGLRLVCIEVPHGAAGSTNWGAGQYLWAPEGVGRQFDLSKGSLSPLEPWREYLTIVSNTDVRMAEAFSAPESGGDHFRSSAVFLTQSHPRQTMGSDVLAGTSLDQLYAERAGKETPIPSMQLCIENIDRAGGCAYGYSCVYSDSISWASPTEPLPMVRDPRLAFDQLFGSGATAEERAARRVEDKSILDTFTGALARLNKNLGASDRTRLSGYLDNVREVERRIQKVEAHNLTETRELPEAPIGVPDSFDEHVKLMFDLQALAFTSDVTRVFSFKMARDGTNRSYPGSGSTAGFHNASHHGEKPDLILDNEKINRYHVSLLPYFLQQLEEAKEGESNLLEKTLVIFGSPMGDSNLHNHKRVPMVMLGHLGGTLKGNIHIKAPDGTSMADSFLTVLHGLGLDHMSSFGDSAAALDLNAVKGAL